MEFRILGPLEVVADDGSIFAFGGQRERALLAILLASANQGVPSERLSADLWGDDPPDGWPHALRVHISRLRKALREAGTGAAISTRPGGYALDVDAERVDAVRFEALVADARRLRAGGGHARAADVVRQALALWRGPALAEVADAPATGAEARRLEEARLGALEERVEADLDAGRHGETVTELEELTHTYPFREHIWALRMRALYRSGRHAEAVAAYQELRSVLAEELGIEPSPELARLNVAILRHDADVGDATLPGAETAMAPETKYARSGGVKIAFQTIGDAAADIVVVPGFVSNVDLYWENPGWRRVFDHLTATSRLILWDKRGTGLSDPVQRVPTLDERTDDLLAVMDAAQSKEATLFGISEGGPMSLLFAATHPERVRALILYGVSPRFTVATDWPWGWSDAESAGVLGDVEARWGEGALFDLFAPTEVADDRARQAWSRTQRAGASPAMGRAVIEAMMATDCRGVLSAVAVPTLVLHRRGDRVAHVEAGRFVADSIRDARFVELAGDNHLLPAGELEPVLSEIDAFLAGADHPRTIDRALVTVLCAEFGPDDRGARAVVRREVARFDGSVENGDTMLATFATPSSGLACAHAIRETVQVPFRLAIHTGECQIGSAAAEGLVHQIARRLAGIASPNEVLVTATVKDLVAGSSYVFVDERSYELREIAGTRVVFALAC